MAPKIRKLSETVINQIAAGEVVENPASIVKELIDNSIDAGAKRIDIDIRSGGQQLLLVEDDGCGMNEENAALSLERHATSKITEIEDLSGLTTMGFRGEALAAIASVSHFEMRTSDGERGTRVLVEGGKVIGIEPCARNQGTSIEVRSLFYNTPARRKFQKSPSTNAAQVTRLVETMALGFPEISFSLSHHGKKSLSFDAADWKKRVEDVLGPLEHEALFEEGPFKIFGKIASPDRAGNNRLGQFLFVNRRPIFSPLVSRAVKEAFGTRIAEKKHPHFALFLTLPQSSVDINVHPQKKEARFQDEEALYQAFYKAVSIALSPLSSVCFPDPFHFEPPPPPFSHAESSFFPSFPIEDTASEFDFVFPDQPLAVFGNYLLLQKQTLILVDLNALSARLLFSSIKEKKKGSQTLVLPLEIELERGEEGLVEEMVNLGVECRLLGKILAIDALPETLEAADFPAFFSYWKEERNERSAVSKFCRQKKKNFSLDEAKALWRALQTVDDSCYDPLGNRIWIELKETDLKGWFSHAH